MNSLDDATRVPDAFRSALAGMRAVRPRPEISLEETSPPRRIAPYAAAFTAGVLVGGREVGDGRLVLLHDPDGQEGWHGTSRLVTHLRAEVEPEIAADPLLVRVGWSWLVDALHAHDAPYSSPAGTVTRSASEGFGGLAGSGSTTEMALRASWTPTGSDYGAHLQAWCGVLATAAGLIPEPGGTTSLRGDRCR